MQIDVIPEMALTAQDDSAIAALLDRAFGPGFDGRSFFKQRHHLRIVARRDGDILGHVALLMRDIRLGARLVPIIGLAEVATDPACRGQGIAGALLTEALTQARASLAEFVVLFGDRPIYAGHGFLRANNTLTYALLDDAQTQGMKSRVDDGLMILPLRGSAWDFQARVDLVGHLF
ncbi:N-acetyltransferase [Loktanella sp. TSTF-M6]|uniref:N-acetyltransferase n=1 Tax=Loktanella gaetbuli TaxID=2881335 RepID=A0ABS8BUG6_9RHOB|nr:N-acetyltransferase [Loktanella gaetbuli]MCB5199368.1 N-acetyltransferase [Loktanella gaetbuli]